LAGQVVISDKKQRSYDLTDPKRIILSNTVLDSNPRRIYVWPPSSSPRSPRFTHVCSSSRATLHMPWWWEEHAIRADGCRDGGGFRRGLKPRLRVTSNAEELWPKANWQSSDFGRSKKLFHTSQTGPPFCAFYWVTTFSSAKRVSGWPRGRNLGGAPETGFNDERCPARCLQRQRTL